MNCRAGDVQGVESRLGREATTGQKKFRQIRDLRRNREDRDIAQRLDSLRRRFRVARAGLLDHIGRDVRHGGQPATLPPRAGNFLTGRLDYVGAGTRGQITDDGGFDVDSMSHVNFYRFNEFRRIVKRT